MRLARSRRPLLALAALSTLALGACVGDGDELITDPGTPATGEILTRYVALGNSITAGFQSGGIVDSLQLRSYPAFLAARAGAPFHAPLIRGPGCPQPFTGPLTPAPAPPPGAACGRITTPPYVSNVAVPGAKIADLFLTPSNLLNPFHRLYGLLTGGRSQIQAMLDAQPTFVTVWIGNNDALGAAIAGHLGPTAPGGDPLLTPLASFQASVNQMAAAIDGSTAQGAVLIGVVNPTFAPILQPGAYFFLSRDTLGEFRGKPVNNNCSPVTALNQPNPLAANLVSFQIVSSAVPEINCDPSQYGGLFVLDQGEIATLTARVNAFNAALEAAANANGWGYVNPNAVLAPLLNQTTNVTIGGQPVPLYQNIRKCQALPTATNADEFRSAVLRSCPVPPTGSTAPFAAPNMFGSLISLDAVHPSTAAHRILAAAIAAEINATYGTTIPTT